MSRSAATAFAVIAATGFAWPAASAVPDSIFRVSLNRGGCFGSCPVYRVEIRSSGLVRFTGSRSVAEPSVPCQGARRWRIDPTAVARLEALIERKGFSGFKPEYIAGLTDQASSTVTVTRRGHAKSVRDYAGWRVGMPKAMTDIEAAIDIAAGDRDCVIARTAASHGR